MTHSFPTRRSSDLWVPSRKAGLRPLECTAGTLYTLTPFTARSPPKRTSCTWLASPPALATFLVKKDPISPPTSSLAFLATVTFTVPESGVSLTEASGLAQVPASGLARSEEHTSEL